MKLAHPHALNTIALLLFGSMVSTAQAVVLTPAVQQQIQQIETQGQGSGLQMREARKPPEISKQKSEANIENDVEKQRPPMQPQSDLRVTCSISSLVVTASFSNNELQALLTKYKGHPVSFNDLQEAANTLLNFIVRQGI